ncbi:rhomboid-like protein [Colletotrichum plurivorum]|uniref:Rhomboid-like protein n=1 Tax=Colletotrichum plurivorum TaxID=2175906 RepID=A0A8H6KSD3_9PEZI|nr:rhomboid-like protein [Colletotrichum plurivorum]
MNASFGLLPSRSLLRAGLRLCRSSSSTTARTTPATSAYLSTYTFPRARPRPSPWSPTCARSLWPSPATQHPSPSQLLLRWASSSARSEPILTHYEDLPLEYRDKVGLRFRDADLTPAEVKAVFGDASPKPAAANRLLRILHGRRVAGTLDDPAFAVNTAAFTPRQRDAALAYLRETVELDEVLNAGLRAEDELAQLEKDLVEDPQEAAAQSLRDNGKENNDSEAAPKVEYKPDPVYGYSAIDAIRAKNQARNAAEEARLRKEAAERGEDYAENSGTLALPIKRPPMTARMQKWTDDGASSDLEAPPELTFFERILPSAAVVLLLVGGLSALAMVYSPLRDADRLFPEVRASAATVGTILALNTAVFLAWRVPPLWRFLNTYFVMVHGAPRAITMITANFSHMKLSHLATNMFGLWFVGTSLHDEVGRANFLAIYMSSGAVGLLGSLVGYTLRGVLTVSTLGASGAVFGVATAYFWTHRYDYFKLAGFPPEPMNGVQGLGLLGLILGLHVWSMVRPGPATIDVTTHLVGMATGFLGVEIVQARMRKEGGEVEKKREDLVKDAPSPVGDKA